MVFLFHVVMKFTSDMVIHIIYINCYKFTMQGDVKHNNIINKQQRTRYVCTNNLFIYISIVLTLLKQIEFCISGE